MIAARFSIIDAERSGENRIAMTRFRLFVGRHCLRNKFAKPRHRAAGP